MTAATSRPARPARPVVDGPREFVTPEGVDLRLRIASYSERCGAFILDVLILLGVLIALTALVAIAIWRMNWPFGTELMAVIWMLGFFLLRNFYFIGFEIRPGAATAGKRAMGLRVIARDGGRLTADAVFARNAMRELEVFLPAMFLFSSGQGVDAGLIALGAVWSGVFVLFPLFNRDRLRLGDLAAGTLVIQAPKKVLRPDLSAEPLGRFAFSLQQLDAYGVKELHVLEDVLRLRDARTMAAVSERIRRKIGWTQPLAGGDEGFLGAYYAALRGRLETRMLFGHRRKDKFDKA